jgi:hypothetical protein
MQEAREGLDRRITLAGMVAWQVVIMQTAAVVVAVVAVALQ